MPRHYFRDIPFLRKADKAAHVEALALRVTEYDVGPIVETYRGHVIMVCPNISEHDPFVSWEYRYVTHEQMAEQKRRYSICGMPATYSKEETLQAAHKHIDQNIDGISAAAQQQLTPKE